jgi:PhnB protein
MTTTQVNPVPMGMHTLTPHLCIKGAAAAIEFYKSAFGAIELGRTPGADGRLLHAMLKIGDSFLMLTDEFPEWGGKAPGALGGTPVTVHLQVPDCDASFARAVEAGAVVKMPLADMFWGDRYGMLTDPFGHAWSVASHKVDLTPEQILAASKGDCA